jgi:hypothetical protein
MAAFLPLITMLFAAEPVWPDLAVQPAKMPVDLGRDVALVLAVEDYGHPALPDVAGAEANARAWRDYLKARGARTVKLMVNSDVTREKVLGTEMVTGAASQLRALAAPGGRVWVVFVGHGAPGEGGGALVGWDATRDATGVRTRSIGQEALLDALGANDGVPVIAIFDACFSGRTAVGELAPGVQPVRAVEVRTARTSTILVAAKSNEYAGDLSGLNRPAFSWLVLGALRGWGDANRDGRVTASEAVDWAGAQMVELVNNRSQTPELFGEAGVALATGTESAPNLSALLPRVTTVPGGGGATPLTQPKESSGTSFGTVGVITVDEKLAEQACDQERREKGTAAQKAHLDSLVKQKQSEALAAWTTLKPGAERCLGVADPVARADCATKVETFAKLAQDASVTLSKGDETVQTSCGPRVWTTAAESRAAPASSSVISEARSLSTRLRTAPTTPPPPAASASPSVQSTSSPSTTASRPSTSAPSPSTSSSRPSTSASSPSTSSSRPSTSKAKAKKRRAPDFELDTDRVMFGFRLGLSGFSLDGVAEPLAPQVSSGTGGAGMFVMFAQNPTLNKALSSSSIADIYDEAGFSTTTSDWSELPGAHAGYVIGADFQIGWFRAGLSVTGTFFSGSSYDAPFEDGSIAVTPTGFGLWSLAAGPNIAFESVNIYLEPAVSLLAFDATALATEGEFSMAGSAVGGGGMLGTDILFNEVIGMNVEGMLGYRGGVYGGVSASVALNFADW